MAFCPPWVWVDWKYKKPDVGLSTAYLSHLLVMFIHSWEEVHITDELTLIQTCFFVRENNSLITWISVLDG